MSNNIDKSVLLVGAGRMAIEYARVLQALSCPFQVVGRSHQSAQTFLEKTGVSVYTGGVEKWTEESEHVPRMAIVAIGAEQLAPVTIRLLKKGVKRILVEKPGGLNEAELAEVLQVMKKQGAQVLIGYNRRYYAATIKAEEIICADGGLRSFHFEFTEWSHLIRGSTLDERVKRNWLVANSSHVIDLAFHLAGPPVELHALTAGWIDWHQAAGVFSGAGKVESGALFSYFANWQGPGGWRLECITAHHRLIWKPLETLQIQGIAERQVEHVEIDDSLDRQFKPGIYRQTKNFIEGVNNHKLVTLEEQIENFRTIYSKILCLNRKEGTACMGKKK